MQKMSSKDEQLLRASTLFDGQCHQIQQDDFELLASDEVRTHLKNWSLIGSTLRNELPAQLDPNFADKVMSRIAETKASDEALDSDLPSMLASKSAFKAGLAAYAQSHAHQAHVGPYEDEMAVGAYEQEQSVGAYEHKLSANTQRVAHVGPYESQVKGSYEQPVEDVNLARPQRHAGWLNLKRIGIFASQIAIAASVAIVAVVGLQTYNASDISVEHPASTSYTTNSAIGGLSLTSYQNNDGDVLMQFNNQMPRAQIDNSNGNNAYRADLKQQQEKEIERINLYIRGYVFDTAANK